MLLTRLVASRYLRGTLVARLAFGTTARVGSKFFFQARVSFLYRGSLFVSFIGDLIAAFGVYRLSRTYGSFCCFCSNGAFLYLGILWSSAREAGRARAARQPYLRWSAGHVRFPAG